MPGSGFRMIDNYIYVYQLQQFFVIPTFPDTVQDQMEVSYSQTSPMSRSAPIYSFQHSGPRSFQVNLDLHRDMMYDINWQVSNAVLETGEDYVDALIRGLQASALPSYALSEKMVDPPMIALRFGNSIFIKGIISGSVGVQHGLPILEDYKYAHVIVSFQVYEIDPFDATTVLQAGSFRGIDTTLERNFWKRD